MRAYKRIAITLVVVLALGIASTAYLLSQQTSKLEKAQSEIVTLRGELTNLQTSLAAPEAKSTTLQTSLAASEAKAATLQTSLAASEAKAATLQTNLEKVQTDYNTLKGDYDKLSADYQSASSQLTQIQKVYPPRNFTSYDELNTWVQKHMHYGETSNCWGTLTVQTEAAKDGYLVSAAFEPPSAGNIRWFYNTAIAGNDLYSWVPWTANTPANISFTGMILVPIQK